MTPETANFLRGLQLPIYLAVYVVSTMYGTRWAPKGPTNAGWVALAYLYGGTYALFIAQYVTDPNAPALWSGRAFAGGTCILMALCAIRWHRRWNRLLREAGARHAPSAHRVQPPSP